MLGDDHQRGRSDNGDACPIPSRRIEGRQRQPARCADRLLDMHKSEHTGQHIADDDGDQDRNDFENSAEQYRPERADQHRDHGDRDGRGIRGPTGGRSVRSDEAGHLGGRRNELEPDHRDDRPHGSRREYDVDPGRSHITDQQGDDDEDDANYQEAADRGVVPFLPQNDENGREKGEAGAEISGNFPLGNEEVQQGPDAVHQQDRGWVDLEQDGHKNRGPEHGKQVLQPQRQALPEGRSLMDLDDSRH